MIYLLFRQIDLSFSLLFTLFTLLHLILNCAFAVTLELSRSDLSLSGLRYVLFFSGTIIVQVIKRCSTTKARYAQVILPHSTVETPVFMPVGTQGTMKGMYLSINEYVE